ncbi:pectin lyase-like protein [Trichodelitschia bisporula]|uniref:galacturonan 1,4-alpha-galacturonidase n=1 Tax=Trichodelitschia bisporula TaxID=703511 RepID=A0A6G1HL89_9PEZI|nr:pectin lyase-like protein [Trichodelitschia bisporula]
MHLLHLLATSGLALGATVTQLTGQVAFDIAVGPKPPFKPIPPSTPRTKECVVKSGGGGDDTPHIMEAVKACNGGGKVVFTRGVKYTVGTAMDLSKLEHVDLVINGQITFTNDVAYWQKHGFKHNFQDAMTFFQLGGVDVNVYGGGTLDGNGGVWKGKSPRPILFGTIGLKGGRISDLTLRNSPQWFHLVKDSQDVVYSDLRISGHNGNTDGWDTYNSRNIVIQNSNIDNGDDCVSFKPGSIDILVQGLVCSGSHGISVGSLGQYRGKTDIVENIMVYNVSMANASNGARIKTWSGGHSAGGGLEGGGGSGRVANVTYENMRVSKVDSAIEITQCYMEKDMAKCKANPSKVTISNILMQGFSGTTSGKKNTVGSLTCASAAGCKNIVLKDINVRAPGGSKAFSCNNIHPSGVSCA